MRCEPPIIVAIDDNVHELEIIQQAAERLSMAVLVLTATDEKTALQLLRTHGPCVRVVVLDVHIAHADGRWLCSQIQQAVPHAQVVPYSANRLAVEHLLEMGAATPIYKPVVSLEEATAALDRALIAGPPPPPRNRLYSFLAAEAPRVLRLTRTDRHVPRVALLTTSASIRLGLCHMIRQAGGEVVNEHRQHDVQWFAACGCLNMLVCTPEQLQIAQAASVSHSIPVLVYVPCGDVSLLQLPKHLNVVAEPLSLDALADALQTVAAGGQYQNATCAWLRFSPQQRRLIQLVRTQKPIVSIAQDMQLSESRVRHLLTDIYKELHIDGLAALRAWVQAFDSTTPPSMT